MVKRLVGLTSQVLYPTVRVVRLAMPNDHLDTQRCCLLHQNNRQEITQLLTKRGVLYT